MSQNRSAGQSIFNSLLEAPVNPTLALLCPGQGAQKVGMGKEVYEAFASSRAVFEEADEALDQSIREVCFEGPEERLTETANAQPAIVTTSLAYLAAALEARVIMERPAFAAGHSLGEYTSLVAAGSLAAEKALSLVRERGRLMAEAGRTNPGTMAAVLGLDETTVLEICRESGAETANFNGPTQTVVGGSVEAVERASALVKERGGKVLAVPVSGAFHTSLMAPAAEAFDTLMEQATIRDPAIPVISNVTGEPLRSAAEVRDDLCRQISAPVQWSKTIQFMLAEGVDTFIELGPGRTLTGMLKRIAPEARFINLDSVESLAALNV